MSFLLDAIAASLARVSAETARGAGPPSVLAWADMRRVIRGRPLLVAAVTAGVSACGTSGAIDGGSPDSTSVNDGGLPRDAFYEDAGAPDVGVVNDGGLFLDAPPDDAPRPDASSVNDGGAFLDAPPDAPDDAA